VLLCCFVLRGVAVGVVPVFLFYLLVCFCAIFALLLCWPLFLPFLVLVPPGSVAPLLILSIGEPYNILILLSQKKICFA
jgi:hypothetical protein